MTDNPEQNASSDSVWAARAEALLEQALAETCDGKDSIPTVTAALTALRIEAGELPAGAMNGYAFPGEDEENPECTCPPDLVARGGFSSRCPAHGGQRVTAMSASKDAAVAGPGTYCAFRMHHKTCLIVPVTSITKTRIRLGKQETFVYHLCEYHAKAVKRR